MPVVRGRRLHVAVIASAVLFAGGAYGQAISQVSDQGPCFDNKGSLLREK